MSDATSSRPPPRDARPVEWRALAIQIAIALAILWLGWQAIGNVAENMRARNIPSNFDFLSATAGFDLNQSLIAYSATSTYGRAFLVGLLNTLAVAAIGIFFATIIGFAVGVARLSQNWMAAKLATIYVEVIRNTPLLLQLFFWYTAVLAPLPGPRQSISLPALGLRMPDPQAGMAAITAFALASFVLLSVRNQIKGSAIKAAGYAISALFMILMIVAILFGPRVAGFGNAVGILDIRDGAYVFLNNRGLFLPFPSLGEAAIWLPAIILASAIGATGFSFWAKSQREEKGRILPVFWISMLILIVPAALTIWAAGSSVTIDYPQLRGFNLAGGVRVYPEFFALVLGLSLYTASFIAEIVRAGILSVAKGQSEAALALGLRRPTILKLVIIPQAMRVVIPPLTNQYLNLTKNSSLAVFIGFPDLVQIFVGTVLNQTGAMIQIISITMAVYLVISLLTSLAMNFYNNKMALSER